MESKLLLKRFGTAMVRKRNDCVLSSCAELAPQVPLEKCFQENGVNRGGDGGVEDQEETGTHLLKT